MYSSLGFKDVNRPTTCYSSVFRTDAWYYYTMHGAREASKTVRLYFIPPAGYREVGMQMQNSVAVRVTASVFQDDPAARAYRASHVRNVSECTVRRSSFSRVSTIQVIGAG